MNKTSYGISSQTSDGNHIYFGDADMDLNITEMNAVIRKLQEQLLSEILVIKTCNGYNFVCFDKMSLDDVHTLNNSIPLIDEQFNEFNYKRKYYTLRMGDDKSVYAYHGDIHNTPVKDSSKSNGHRIFFNNIFSINISRDPYYDNSTYFQMVKYTDVKER